MADTLKIGILGHVGNQNLGDEAIFAAVIQNVRRWFPSALLVGYTSHPEDTTERHGIPAYAIRRVRPASPSQPAAHPTRPRHEGIVSVAKRAIKRLPLAKPIMRSIEAALQELRFLAKSYPNLDGLDCLVIAGSQQLNDFVSGPWGFAFTIFKWAAMARFRRVQVIVLSVGAGPIDTRLGRWFIRRALGWARYRSYRDPRSLEVVTALGIEQGNFLVPDLVFSYELNDIHAAERRTGDPLVVGINPLPFFDANYWHASDGVAYTRYVGVLAEFADSVVAAGHVVSFFPTQLKVDPGVIHDVRAAMKTRGASVLEPAVNCFDDLIAALRSMDLVVATRYHGILLSLLCQKPVLGLAYHGKSRDLMDLFGLGEYSIDVEACTSAALAESLSSLASRRDEVQQQIAARLPGIRKLLADQYDQILADLAPARISTDTRELAAVVDR